MTEAEKIEICTDCEIDTCDESHKDCAYQNSLPQRTVAIVKITRVKPVKSLAPEKAEMRRRYDGRIRPKNKPEKGPGIYRKRPDPFNIPPPVEYSAEYRHWVRDVLNDVWSESRRSAARAAAA